MRVIGQDIKYYNWEFNLIQDDKTINAFCMPGGKIAFYTILEMCELCILQFVFFQTVH